MRKYFLIVLLSVSAFCQAAAQEFVSVPRAWKWLDSNKLLCSYDGSYADSSAFAYDVRKGEMLYGVTAPEKYSDFPVKPEGAVNLTYSPDSTKIAFTRDNDIYVVDIASGVESRLTFDGSDLILNGYASWVYYEEILGRSSRYKAFWWSPDSRKIGFYRFDNTQVPLFPIYSAYGKDYAGHLTYPASAPANSQSPRVTNLGLGGSVSETRYPKCGQTNPQVRIGVVAVPEVAGVDGCGVAAAGAAGAGAAGAAGCGEVAGRPTVVWADFDPTQDQYFGIPFWGPDSEEFFIARMPRLQNTIDLYAVSVADGSKRHVYNEKYTTWLNWFNGVVFTDKGLYMAREFETGWQQIYFLSYDGKEFRRLTDGTNWSVSILRVDEKRGDVYFTAKRDASVRQAVYKVDAKGVITMLTDPAYNAVGVRFSPDGKYFAASISNVTTPTRLCVFNASSGVVSKGHGGDIAKGNLAPAVAQKLRCGQFGLSGKVIADMKGPDYDPAKYALGKLVHITVPCAAGAECSAGGAGGAGTAGCPAAGAEGFTLPAMIVYPLGFDESKKYPVHVDIYGGPNTPVVRDRWVMPSDANQWYSRNGVIQIWVDPRSAGHNGREGLDMIYKQLTVNEVADFCSWGRWLQSLPYVQGDKIGVEGFSFGGTMTTMLLCQAPDIFHYGVAGGGVYDWALYDSHYTERYMDTPAANPEGYRVSCVLNYVGGYPVEYRGGAAGAGVAGAGVAGVGRDECAGSSAASGPVAGMKPVEKVMLKLTHGTGDDNVHHQNTLQLIDALHKAGKKFELMIYPDGMHGYYGYQGDHFEAANFEFWTQYLL